jgi:hypothetical protein
MADSLASLTFFNALIPGAASRVNLIWPFPIAPGSLWIDTGVGYGSFSTEPPVLPAIRCLL